MSQARRPTKAKPEPVAELRAGGTADVTVDVVADAMHKRWAQIAAPVRVINVIGSYALIAYVRGFKLFKTAIYTRFLKPSKPGQLPGQHR
jgi:hypothetical protein